MVLNQIAREASKVKVSRGFEPADWDNHIQVASKLALVHTEVSEAVEEVRVGNLENFHEELIDVLIRTLELLHETGADIDAIYAMKTKKNREREWMHGKKRF